MSPHVVDLTRPTPFDRPRELPDFSQRAARIGHAVRRTFRENLEERSLSPHRRVIERSVSGPRLAGFLRLLPAMMRGLRLPLQKKLSAIPPAPVRALKPLPAPRVIVPPPVPKPYVAPTPLSTKLRAWWASHRPLVSFRRSVPKPVARPRAAAPKAPAPAMGRGGAFVIAAAWKRRVAVFCTIAIVVTLPFYGLMAYAGMIRDARSLAATAASAAGALKDAGESAMRFDPRAGASFDRAAQSFAETRSRVERASVQLAAFAAGQGERLSSGKKLLTAGESFARAGEEISAAFGAFEANSDAATPDRVRALAAALHGALPHLERAVDGLEGVSERSLPEAFREAFSGVRGDLRGMVSDLRRVADSSDALLALLGADGKRRYLVVFQNDRELRPTGGFIGSFALMDVKDGRIDNIEIPAGGSYDLRGGLNQRVAAPEQLRLVNARWEFQDANWFADFPTSARTLTWFYEKSGGPTVDGVVAINAGVMEALLAVVGPIALPEHDKTLDAANFYEETQKAVEFEYDRELNRPKQIISDMAPSVLQKAVEAGSERLLPLAGTLGDALAAKDIQVYFRDEQEQALAREFGWTGELAPLPGADFLAVVDTNIAGGKTDGAILAEMDLETEIGEDGSIVNTLTITRTHRGRAGELFTGIKNIDYLRAYVPEGSILLSAEGFERPGSGYFMEADDTLQPSTLLAAVEGETSTHAPSGTRISREAGLTVFGNWTQLEPGETRTVRLRYRLPMRLGDLVRAPDTWTERLRDALGAWSPVANLKLVVRRQSGADDRRFSARVRVPDGWQVLSAIPDGAVSEAGGYRYDVPLDRDLYLGAVLGGPESR